MRITQCIDPELRQRTKIAGCRNPGSFTAFNEVLSDGADAEDLMALRVEIADWAKAYKMPKFPLLHIVEVTSQCKHSFCPLDDHAPSGL